MAQNGTEILNRFVEMIINPLMYLIFTAGFFLFVWGLVQFLRALDDDGRGTRHEEGKQHMLWGIVGMVIMVSVQSILMLLSGTFNLGYSPGQPSKIQVTNDLNNIPQVVKFR